MAVHPEATRLGSPTRSARPNCPVGGPGRALQNRLSGRRSDGEYRPLAIVVIIDPFGWRKSCFQKRSLGGMVENMNWLEPKGLTYSPRCEFDTNPLARSTAARLEKMSESKRYGFKT
jgi:hypothetical protein